MAKQKDVFKSALDKADELDKINFSSGEGIDVESYYSALEKIALKNNSIKNDEAENVISEQASVLINEQFTSELEEKRKRIENFIRTYDPNKDIVKNLELKDVDKIYAISNYLLNSYIQFVNEMKFNFDITKEEYKFLNKALTYEISYNSDEIFNFVRLESELWSGVQQLAEENKALDGFTFVVDIKMILILQHLMKDVTVKGHSRDFTLFKNILFKIAQVSKLFNAYNIVIERIKGDREVWGSALDVVASQKESVLEEVETPKKNKS